MIGFSVFNYSCTGQGFGFSASSVRGASHADSQCLILSGFVQKAEGTAQMLGHPIRLSLMLLFSKVTLLTSMLMQMKIKKLCLGNPQKTLKGLSARNRLDKSNCCTSSVDRAPCRGQPRGARAAARSRAPRRSGRGKPWRRRAARPRGASSRTR